MLPHTALTLSLRQSQPTCSQAWDLFMKLHFFSHLLACTMCFPGCPCMACAPCQWRLPMSCLSLYHTAFLHVLSSDIHGTTSLSLPFKVLMGFHTSHTEMSFLFSDITVLPWLPSFIFSLLSFAALWCPYLSFHTLPPERHKSLFSASHCFSPHGCPFFKWAGPWAAVGRVLRCHIGRASTARLQDLIKRFNDS